MAANGVLNEMWTTSRARLGMGGSIKVRFPDFRSVTFTFSSSLLKVPIISTNGKQDFLKQPEANTDLLHFSGLSYHKSSVETSFLSSLLSHSRIRIIVLTCPDNINVISQVCKKSSAEIIRAVPAKSHKSQC